MHNLKFSLTKNFWDTSHSSRYWPHFGQTPRPHYLLQNIATYEQLYESFDNPAVKRCLMLDDLINNNNYISLNAN